MARKHDYNHRGITGGIILIALGLAFLLDQFYDINIWRFWPVILIVVGIVALKNGLDERNRQ